MFNSSVKHRSEMVTSAADRREGGGGGGGQWYHSDSQNLDREVLLS